MSRGAKRGFSTAIPKHIDQAKIPSGMYFDATGNGRWYVKETHPETGKRKQITVANANARLSELHEIMEARLAGAKRGTLDWLWGRFEASTEFAALSPATQRDYRVHAKLLENYPTRLGHNFGQITVERLSVPIIQQLIEAVARGRPASKPGADDGIRPRPSTANHVLRFLRRLFAWGIRFGCCTANPAKGVKQVREAGEFKMPLVDAFQRALAFAQERGVRADRTKGSCPDYLAPVMVIAYSCRLRGSEVLDLTDTDVLPDGLRNRRRKGSLTNGTTWTPELRAAVATLQARRKRIDKARGFVPLAPGGRPLLVAPDGEVLDKSSLDSAWQRFMRLAMDPDDGVLAPEERFTLHGLKHKGITDTGGTRAAKKDASGHRTVRAFDRYDHELKWHGAAGKKSHAVEHENSVELSGELSGAKEKGAT